LKVEEIRTYQKNWKEHVERMQDGRFPKLALNTNQLESEAEVVPKKKKMERSVLGRQLRKTGLIT
jgi:hypothetical protein